QDRDGGQSGDRGLFFPFRGGSATAGKSHASSLPKEARSQKRGDSQHKEVEENLGEKQSTGLVAGGVSESRFSGGDQNRSRESAENTESHKNERGRRKIATGGKTANRERREQNDQTEKREMGGDKESGEVENRVGRDQSDSGELPQFARSGNFQHSRHGGPENT